MPFKPNLLDRVRFPATAPSRFHAVAILLALLAAIAAPLWHLHIIDRNMPPEKSDLQAVRIGVQQMLHGDNPYSDLTTRQIQTAYYGRPLTAADNVNKMGFAYPATTGIVLAILAPLSWNEARWTFLLIMPILTALSVLLWLRIAEIQVSRPQAAILSTLTLASWPVMWGLRLQQPTLIVALFLAAACFQLKRGNEIGAGILLTLATIKPQLAGLLIAWLVLWAFVHSRWRFLGSFTVSLVLLLIGAEAIVPGWLAPWHNAGIELLQYTHQQPALLTIFGKWLGTALIVAVAAAGGLVLWRLRRCEADSPGFGLAISLALAATISLNPTYPATIYNQVLLVPAVLVLIHLRPASYFPALARRISLALLGWGFAATVLAVLCETIGHPAGFWVVLPFQNDLLPVSAVVALVSMTTLQLESSRNPALPQLENSPAHSD
jgi:hypothetical protein